MLFLDHIWLIPLLPAFGAAMMFFCGRRLQKATVDAVCVGVVVLAFLFACFTVVEYTHFAHGTGRPFEKIVYTWLGSGDGHLNFVKRDGTLASFNVDAGFLLDPLSSIWLLFVTGVGMLIHIYSTGYMAHEGGYYRFFGYMNLFMFSMLTLILANNYILLFVGWEGVGLCSYLLIGFYFHRHSASTAANKAFIVNRIGDAGFILGALTLSWYLGSFRFIDINKLAHSGTFAIGDPVLTAAALLLFVGACGKSAQLPLYVWLPDAMEGPTPVSALIHAATMVTAGVYMVARSNAIFVLAPTAMKTVAIIGALTAVFAASIALVQNDIKRVLAYSTISQLGYMFLALGVGAFAAGVFHVFTHAFFKALLFLGSGSVIHSMSGEQDLQKMGGLWNKIPITAKTFAVATLAIAGIFPFAGFFSKDEILGQAFDRYFSLWLVGFITAGMTAFYMFRLLFLTFFGYSRADEHVEKHVHESPPAMTVPLIILAGLSLIGGWIGWPGSLGGENRFERFLEPVLTGVVPETGAVKIAHHALAKEYFLMLASLSIAGAGIWLAYQFYRTKRIAPELVAGKWPRLYHLLLHKYYLDEIYDAAVVERTKDLGTLLGRFDANVIDGVGVNGAGWLARFGSTLSMWWDKWIIDGLLNFSAKLMQLFSYPVRLLQTGMFSSYAMFILVGLVVLLAYYGRHVQAMLHSVR